MCVLWPIFKASLMCLCSKKNILRCAHLNLAQLLASALLLHIVLNNIFCLTLSLPFCFGVFCHVQSDFASRINAIIHSLVHTDGSWDWFLLWVFLCQGIVIHLGNNWSPLFLGINWSLFLIIYHLCFEDGDTIISFSVNIFALEYLRF